MKFIKSSIIFFLIFFLGQYLIMYSLDYVLSKSSFRYSKLFFQKEEMNHDILCIGNSRGVNSFYTPYINNKFSKNSFNISYNGLTMPLESMFLEEYLDKNNSPEIVFIEISNIFNNDSITGYSGFKIYSGQSDKLNNRIQTTDKKSYLLSSIFPIYRYNSELLYRSVFYLTKKSDQDWINRYTISTKLKNDVSKMSSFQLPINKIDLSLLIKTIKLLKSKGIKTHLYLAPYLPEYQEKIENLESLLAIVENKTGLQVVNISNLLTKSEYFSDRIHTNEKGAQFIGDTLMAIALNRRLRVP